jgi:hypothetical protein
MNWTKLLGKFDINKHYVDEDLISERRDDGCHVLWWFDTAEEAAAAFEEWKREADEQQS